MRRGNDARVDVGSPGAAQSLDVLVLQHAQQLDLHVGRQVTNLVEEDRRGVGELEASDLARQGSRIRTFLPAEELALDQRRGNGRAVDADHGPGAAPAQLVNLRGEQLLARASLTEEEDRRVGLGHLAHLLLHAANRGALVDEVGHVERAVDFAAQVAIFHAQLIAQALDFGERRAERLVASPAGDHAGEHAGDQTQALKNVSRPLPRRARDFEGHDADDPLRHR